MMRILIVEDEERLARRVAQILGGEGYTAETVGDGRSALARAVLKVLSENRMPGVPVVDADGYLVGFVSEGHLLASALPKYLAAMEDLSFIKESGDTWVHYLAESADRRVSEVMSTEVSSLELGKSEVAVAHKMVHDGASSVMITENGKLVGIVNRLDLYAAVVGIEVE